MADQILPEAEAAAQRLKLRQALKQVYLKQITHPHRHGAGEGGYVVWFFYSYSYSSYLS